MSTKAQQVVSRLLEEAPLDPQDGLRYWKAHWTDKPEAPVPAETEAKTGIGFDDLDEWIESNQVTPEQGAALRRVRTRWKAMETPEVDNLNGCIMVAVGAGSNPMVLGIEKDGHTHS